MAANDLKIAAHFEEEMSALKREAKSGNPTSRSLSGSLEKFEQLSVSYPGNSMVWKGLAELRVAEQERLGVLALKSMDMKTPQHPASWVSRQNVRQVVHGRDQQFTFEQLLLPQQNAEQWRMARRDFVRALILCPLDDDVRVSLVELDMVIPDADSKSAELLTQAASLRPQHKQFLDYLSWLAKDEPGPAVQRRIEELRLPPDKKR